MEKYKGAIWLLFFINTSMEVGNKIQQETRKDSIHDI
jgi:hypothetical protein